MKSKITLFISLVAVFMVIFTSAIQKPQREIHIVLCC